MRLEGKVAIVTGGGMGIGRSGCQLLAREGAKVTVTDTCENGAMQAVGDIKRSVSPRSTDSSELETQWMDGLIAIVRDAR